MIPRYVVYIVYAAWFVTGLLSYDESAKYPARGWIINWGILGLTAYALSALIQ